MSPAALTEQDRDDKYDRNQDKAVFEMPNNVDRRFINISWSMVSNAAEISSIQRQVIFC